MHLSDNSSLTQHLKKHSCPTTESQKILTESTTILECQNNKQKLQILEALPIRNIQLKLDRINFEMSANVLKISLGIKLNHLEYITNFNCHSGWIHIQKDLMQFTDNLINASCPLSGVLEYTDCIPY